jgi:hypothetical protein
MSKDNIFSDPDHGIHISGFSSLNEAMADMAKAEDAANERLWPEQRPMIDSQDEQWFISIAVNSFC